MYAAPGPEQPWLRAMPDARLRRAADFKPAYHVEADSLVTAGLLRLLRARHVTVKRNGQE